MATVQSSGENALGFCRRFVKASRGTLRDAADRLLAKPPRKAPASCRTRVMADVWNNYFNNEERKRAMTIGPAVQVRSTPLVIPAGA